MYIQSSNMDSRNTLLSCKRASREGSSVMVYSERKQSYCRLCRQYGRGGHGESAAFLLRERPQIQEMVAPSILLSDGNVSSEQLDMLR